MWALQDLYYSSIRNFARKLFKMLSQQIDPVVFLIGFERKKQRDCHSIHIWPERHRIYVNSFFGVDELAKSIYNNDPRRNNSGMDPILHQRFKDDLKKDCSRKAVKQLVDQNCEENKISFVSQPERFGIYDIFVVLQIKKDVYNSFYPLNRSEMKIHDISSQNVYKSLIDALGHIFLKESIDVLHNPGIKGYYDAPMMHSETLLRIAATNFIGTVISGSMQSVKEFNLFNKCNHISSLKYEGDSSVGKIIICEKNHPNIDIVLKLANPVRLDSHVGIRKLLEITSDELHLHSDGMQITGLARLVGNYNSQQENLFIISFTGSHKWQFLHDDQIIMNVKDTYPVFQHPGINKRQFDDLLERTFQDISYKKRMNIWRMVNESTKQKHGALIIISGEAEKESKRLKQQSTRIDPTLLNKEIMRKVTSIDGAVLLDPTGMCYSIGVILDGSIASKGDSTRGSRFNSAVTYVEMKERKCVAVITSEDGMINLYPELEPRIKKSEIDKHLTRLISLVDKDTGDYDEYDLLVTWFFTKRFYLSQEECDQINTLGATFNEKWINGLGMPMVFYDLKPNSEMNDSYFLNEN